MKSSFGLSIFAIAAVQGCGGDVTPVGPVGAGGLAAGGAAMSGGASGASTGGAPAGGANGGGNPSQSCTDFCDREGKLCGGENAAYPSLQFCLVKCAGFAPGDATHSGDTFACRDYHLNNVMSMGVSHCPHTGAISKANFADTTATGPCK